MHLMRWLAHGGAGFDCASEREISTVKNLQVPADIIFANPCKKIDDIYSSCLQNIKRTVVDSHEEIDKLVECRWSGSSLIRIRVDDSGSTMPFSAKFGLDLAEVRYLASYANMKGQPISGISFHVGSDCKTSSQYSSAIQQANSCLEVLRDNGHIPTTIDIGGGFTNDSFSEAATVIRNQLSKLKDITVIAEPGRFFAETSHDLFVKVIGKKPGLKNGFRYTLDESLYGQFSCIPFDHAKPQWIRVRDSGEPMRRKVPAILYGRTCDSLDMIASAEHAEELYEGDWLWFPNMGAYTTVTSTEFNGFPKPPSFILEEYRTEYPELPYMQEFQEEDWPQGLKYVTSVSVPQ